MFFKLANLVMGGMRFLGDETKTEGSIEGGAQQVATDIVNTIKGILIPIISIVAAAGLIWAIILGVNMARADSTEKREESKKRLIALIIGIVIMVALIVFFSVGLSPLLESFGATDGGLITGTETQQ